SRPVPFRTRSRLERSATRPVRVYRVRLSGAAIPAGAVLTALRPAGGAAGVHQEQRVLSRHLHRIDPAMPVTRQHLVHDEVAALRQWRRARISARAMRVPTLIMTGDEDWPCLEPGLLMKRNIATAALVVMPNAGHAINLEDPAAFNRHLTDFFQTVDAGRWPTREQDQRTLVATGQTVLVPLA